MASNLQSDQGPTVCTAIILFHEICIPILLCAASYPSLPPYLPPSLLPSLPPPFLPLSLPPSLFSLSLSPSFSLSLSPFFHLPFLSSFLARHPKASICLQYVYIYILDVVVCTCPNALLIFNMIMYTGCLLKYS